MSLSQALNQFAQNLGRYLPDLTGYDVFMKPRQPWERKEA